MKPLEGGAAMEFTPAMMKHGPVDVWSTLTFNFKLTSSDT
jgi:hypothetical protein